MSETTIGHNLNVINKNIQAVSATILHVSKQVESIGEFVVGIDGSVTELHQKMTKADHTIKTRLNCCRLINQKSLALS